MIHGAPNKILEDQIFVNDIGLTKEEWKKLVDGSRKGDDISILINKIDDQLKIEDEYWSDNDD